MVKSLEWTQKEIHAFGGDPLRVTLFGYSSGGRAVSQLSLSPELRGLFHQVILMSGTALGTPFKDSLDVSKAFALDCNCTTEEQWRKKNFEGVLACMRRKSAFQLLDVQEKLFHQG